MVEDNRVPKYKRDPAMKTARLEAFSDGVFG